MFEVPTLDFQALGLSTQDDTITDSQYKCIGSKLVETLSTDGCVFLTSTGLDAQLIDEATRVSGDFFNLSDKTKDKYRLIPTPEEFHGWVKPDIECLSKTGGLDPKESYNACRTSELWPDVDVPGFRDTTLDVYEQFLKIGRRALKALAFGLNIEEKDFFLNNHTNGCGNLRYLLYPSLADTNAVPGQLRCGEHSDFGTLTLSVQDDAGGLQVLSPTGTWVDVISDKESVFVFGADLLQKWTSDKIPAIKHRVVFPEGKENVPRRSMICFVNPDFDTIVSCLDGSDKYEPVSAMEYLNIKLANALPEKAP